MTKKRRYNFLEKKDTSGVAAIGIEHNKIYELVGKMQELEKLSALLLEWSKGDIDEIDEIIKKNSATTTYTGEVFESQHWFNKMFSPFLMRTIMNLTNIFYPFTDKGAQAPTFMLPIGQLRNYLLMCVKSLLAFIYSLNALKNMLCHANLVLGSQHGTTFKHVFDINYQLCYVNVDKKIEANIVPRAEKDASSIGNFTTIKEVENQVLEYLHTRFSSPVFNDRLKTLESMRVLLKEMSSQKIANETVRMPVVLDIAPVAQPSLTGYMHFPQSEVIYGSKSIANFDQTALIVNALLRPATQNSVQQCFDKKGKGSVMNEFFAVVDDKDPMMAYTTSEPLNMRGGARKKIKKAKYYITEPDDGDSSSSSSSSSDEDDAADMTMEDFSVQSSLGTPSKIDMKLNDIASRVRQILAASEKYGDETSIVTYDDALMSSNIQKIYGEVNNILTEMTTSVDSVLADMVSNIDDGGVIKLNDDFVELEQSLKIEQNFLDANLLLLRLSPLLTKALAKMKDLYKNINELRAINLNLSSKQHILNLLSNNFYFNYHQALQTFDYVWYVFYPTRCLQPLYTLSRSCFTNFQQVQSFVKSYRNKDPTNPFRTHVQLCSLLLVPLEYWILFEDVGGVTQLFDSELILSKLFSLFNNSVERMFDLFSVFGAKLLRQTLKEVETKKTLRKKKTSTSSSITLFQNTIDSNVPEAEFKSQPARYEQCITAVPILGIDRSSVKSNYYLLLNFLNTIETVILLQLSSNIISNNDNHLAEILNILGVLLTTSDYMFTDATEKTVADVPTKIAPLFQMACARLLVFCVWLSRQQTVTAPVPVVVGAGPPAAPLLELQVHNAQLKDLLNTFCVQKPQTVEDFKKLYNISLTPIPTGVEVRAKFVPETPEKLNFVIKRDFFEELKGNMDELPDLLKYIEDKSTTHESTEKVMDYEPTNLMSRYILMSNFKNSLFSSTSVSSISSSSHAMCITKLIHWFTEVSIQVVP